MIDLEKVIKGLQEEINRIDEEKNWLDCVSAQTLRDALSLLKAQEPIAPKLIKMYPHDIYECGNCGHRSVGSKDYKAKFCPECGRELKWDATE